MNYWNKISWIAGSVLIGFTAVALLQADRNVRRGRKRANEQPVGELAENLKQAWAGYHTP